VNKENIGSAWPRANAHLHHPPINEVPGRRTIQNLPRNEHGHTPNVGALLTSKVRHSEMQNLVLGRKKPQLMSCGFFSAMGFQNAKDLKPFDKLA